MQRQDRSKTIDIARAIGILLIVINHIEYPYDRIYLNVWAASFYVPLFFLISGMVFRPVQPGDRFIEFLKRKIHTYVIPYLFLGFFVVISEWIQNQWNIYEFVHELCRLLLQRKYYTIWFLATLFVAITVFWIICKFSKNDCRKILAICMIISIGSMKYSRYVGVPLPWNPDTALSALVFVSIGFWLREKNFVQTLDNMQKKKQIIVLIAVFLISVLASCIRYKLYGTRLSMFFSEYGNSNVLTIAIAVVGSIAVMVCASMLNGWKVASLLEYIGKRTLVVFAWHKEIVMCFLAFLMQYIVPELDSYSLGAQVLICSVEFLLIIIICLFLDFVMMRTPINRLLGGKKNAYKECK